MKEIHVRFSHSGETITVQLEKLRKAAENFLEAYGSPSYTGDAFAELVNRNKEGSTANTSSDDAFAVLLSSLEIGEEEFFREIIRQLETANHQNTRDIIVKGAVMPKRFLLAILEVIVPGDNLVSVSSVEQYEKLTNVEVPENERGELQEVIDTYPVRLSKHVIRQSRISRDVAYQFMPFVQELDDTGLKNTWVGQFHKGLLEQMYQNRPIFVLHMTCPVYCRFCFRKHKETRNLPTPTEEDVLEALEYIKKSPRIKEIVLTGGEPLMNKKTLTCAVEGLQKIPHIQTIRIASRCVSYYPQLFYLNDSFWLNYIIDRNREMQKDDKRIEIATHFIHPDEISHYSLEIISKLVKNGVGVYTQTPYLKDCNDHGTELTQLYRELRGAGSEIHYIYIPCSPIQGNNIYWTPISSGVWTAAYLRAHLSDRAMPILCTATKIGKIDWNTSGWAVERHQDDPDYIWIRTPYTEEYYKQFAPDVTIKNARKNTEGTLDSDFMADIGDEKLFLGNLDEAAASLEPFSEINLSHIQQEIMKDQRNRQEVIPSGLSCLHRIHRTRVEVEIDAPQACLEEALDYIRREKLISDVVLAAEINPLDYLDAIAAFAEALYAVPHVNSLRLRAFQFTYAPEQFTDEVISRIAGLNKLSPSMPLRLELETQFIHSSEFNDVHRRIIKQFLASGVTVYNNILLLAGVNDSPGEMMNICYACRQIGIELFQLYTAGIPVQERWNRERPIDASAVIVIATHLRRNQSGREVPLYVVRTAVGDADFNLNAHIVASRDDSVDMRLDSYSLEYFTGMQEGFSWPAEVCGEIDGHPVVRVPGLKVASNEKFFIQRHAEKAELA